MSELLSIIPSNPGWAKEFSRMENIVFSTPIRAQDAQTVPFPDTISPILIKSIRSMGIENLYIHQAEVFENSLNHQHQVLTTGTAGGKSLAYTLPILDCLIKNPTSTALMLFPTKALAQDQLNSLQILVDPINAVLSNAEQIIPAVYDGDTPSAKRKAIREKSRLILSNPDMLHAGILPRNPQWAPFFAGIRYVVIDEIHTYRGVFGSHVANVLRRLDRICHHYSASPVYLMTSASIANPVEHASALTGKSVQLVATDGSARGEKSFCIYNPPISDPELGIRKSAVFETISILKRLLDQDIQTIVFGRARKTIEIFTNYFNQLYPELSPRISAYRSGYLDSDRRRIEKRLRDNDLKAVISTNALELGIDIGSMDAAVLIGYPGTIASTIQQIGRAGRKTNHSLAILVATSNPTDQYLAHHPDYLLGLSPESSLIDPNHLLILLEHIRCAVYELPFQENEPFGNLSAEFIKPYLQVIFDQGLAQWQSGKLFWVSTDYPASLFSLRNTGADQVQLILQTPTGNRTIGEVDKMSSYWMVHPQAIYMHEGKTYQVENLDLDANLAILTEANEDYMTEPQREVEIEILSILSSKHDPAMDLSYGNLNIHSQIKSYKRIRYFSYENLGTYPLDLPKTVFPTTGCWFTIADSVVSDLRNQGKWLNDQNDYGSGWQIVRELVLHRDQYRCRVCGSPENGKSHHVHHIIPFKRFIAREEANQLTNLVTLCPTCHRIAETNLHMQSGLAGIAYAIRHIAPLFIMCDPTDLEVIAESQASNQDTKPSITIYDDIPGGIGLSKGVYDRLPDILTACYQLISECPCTDGCPSCVGPAGENGYGGKSEALALLEKLMLT